MKLERFPEKCYKCGNDLEAIDKMLIRTVQVPIYNDDEHLLEFRFTGVCPSCGAFCKMDAQHIVVKPFNVVERVTKLVFDLLNEYDIGVWEDIEYVPLAEAWCNRVERICDGTDKDDELKAALKEYLFGDDA